MYSRILSTLQAAGWTDQTSAVLVAECICTNSAPESLNWQYGNVHIEVINNPTHILIHHLLLLYPFLWSPRARLWVPPIYLYMFMLHHLLRLFKVAWHVCTSVYKQNSSLPTDCCMEALAGQMFWDLVAVMQISVLVADNWIGGQWGILLICVRQAWPFKDEIADGSKKQFVQTGVYKNRKYGPWLCLIEREYSRNREACWQSDHILTPSTTPITMSLYREGEMPEIPDDNWCLCTPVSPN